MRRRSAEPQHRWHVAVVVENVALGVDTRLRKQVEDLLAAGFELTVVTRSHPDNAPYRGRPGLTVLEHRAPPDGEDLLGYAREYGTAALCALVLLVRTRARRRIDVLQLCQPPDVYFPLAWLLRVLGARVVVDQRDLMPELLRARTDHPSPHLLRLLRRLERETLRVADRVVTVNDHLRRRLLEHDPRARVVVTRNGPVLRRVDAVLEDPCARVARTAGSLVVWSGKMGRQDRVDLVVRLAGEVVRRRGREDVEFVILGDGECLEELISTTEDLGLSHWVHFPGWLAERSVFRWLASADLGLDTSLQHEVTPVKALEYMAFGLPFLCFDLPETRILAEGAADLVPAGDVPALADAVLALLDDPARREVLGRHGRAAVEDELCWERQSGAYVAAVSPDPGTGHGAALGHRPAGKHGGLSPAQEDSSQVCSSTASSTSATY